MKTYKQKHLEMRREVEKAYVETAKVLAENHVLRIALEYNELFDPIKHDNVKSDLYTCVQALNDIIYSTNPAQMAWVYATCALKTLKTYK